MIRKLKSGEYRLYSRKKSPDYHGEVSVVDPYLFSVKIRGLLLLFDAFQKNVAVQVCPAGRSKF